MTTLYCIVHKGDAKWLIGDTLCSATNHAIKHKLYNLNNVREACRQKNMVCLVIREDGTFEAFNPYIPT